MDNKIVNQWRKSNKSQGIELQKLCNLSSTMRVVSEWSFFPRYQLTS